MSIAHSTIEYRDIPGFPGYRIGNDGSIWSARILCARGKGRGRGSASGIGNAWHKIALRRSKNGRLTVNFYPGCHSRQVSRLVLEVFVGPCPNGMQCCHFPDRNPSNNNVSNLKWGTPKENQSHRRIHDTQIIGERSSMAKLTNKAIAIIRAQYRVCRAKGSENCKYGGATLARKYGVSQALISEVATGKGWKHL